MKEQEEQGCIVFDTPESIDFFRLAQLKAALAFELRSGMKMTSRGPSPYTVLKREYGFKGNRQKVLEQVTAEVEKRIAERHENEKTS